MVNIERVVIFGMEEEILKEIKNKIITISGEPVSGKSTVVREIKELYEEKG